MGTQKSKGGNTFAQETHAWKLETVYTLRLASNPRVSSFPCSTTPIPKRSYMLRTIDEPFMLGVGRLLRTIGAVPLRYGRSDLGLETTSSPIFAKPIKGTGGTRPQARITRTADAARSRAA
jgi:hypothetical protein